MQTFCKALSSHPKHLPRNCKQKSLAINKKHATFAVESLTLKTIYVMKHNLHKQIVALVAVLLVTLVNAISIFAQAKVDDKEIIGVWIMTSMKYEGENENHINANYNQVKVYRANGEYACAQIVRQSDGTYIILPHEYGTYSLKGGQYVEMGRPSGAIDWINSTAFRGRWMNRYDEWKKVVNMPEELTLHIVDKCKAAQCSPENLQQMMKTYIFNQ